MRLDKLPVTAADARVRATVHALRADPLCSIARLSEAVHLSESRLKHLFSEHMRMSLSAYAREIRMRHAAHLILHTSMPLEAVGKGAGYTDYSGFSRVFKRWSGETPGSYRRHRKSAVLAPRDSTSRTFAARTSG